MNNKRFSPKNFCLKHTLIFACICIFIFANIQCNWDDREQSGESKITVLYMGDERILSPYWGMEAQLLVFLPIVALKGDGSEDVEPALAERWEHSKDYRIWTFLLIPANPATDSGLFRSPFGAKRRWLFIIPPSGRNESRMTYVFS